MYRDMEQWSEIRRRVLVEGVPKRQILRETGMHWTTLEKILAHSAPPGYRLKVTRPQPKIGPYRDRIVQILEADKTLPKRQRHTAKRIFERIREIGMMRAVGAKRRQIRRMIFAESLLLCLMGISLGVISGIMLSFVMTGVLEFAGMHIPYDFPTAGVIVAIAAGLICGILAALIPARRASDLQIVSALAYE